MTNLIDHDHSDNLLIWMLCTEFETQEFAITANLFYLNEIGMPVKERKLICPICGSKAEMNHQRINDQL